MNWIKVFIINLSVTIGLLLIIEVGLTVIFFVKDNLLSTDEHATVFKPNYTQDVMGFEGEMKNFRNYPYKAFLGWVSPDVHGEYLNVINSRRRTVVSTLIEHKETLHFFGGSTIWGHSVSDKNTIPSLVSKNLKINTINYGEQAYNSRQELNLFLDNLANLQSGDVVIFYDGVNDVYHNCRSHNSPNGHAQEFYIRERLSNKNAIQASILKKLSILRLMEGLSKRLFNPNLESINGYQNSCNNMNYADKVADFIVNNWKAVQAISSTRGINFICGLQPNPYTFTGNITYSFNELKDQVESVYPLIAKKAKNLPCFVDYSKLLKFDNYVDSCCHLNEYGNEEISQQLSFSVLVLLNRQSKLNNVRTDRFSH